MKYKLICGDCAKVMQRIRDNYIDMTLTSPPYDNLRDYKGCNFDFKNIAKQLFRVLKPGGVIVWIVGDATIKGSETGTSFKQALYFKEIGFSLHDTMIYEKNGPAYPAGEKSARYSQIFEYMFIFSKGCPKTINLIKDRANKWVGVKRWGKNTTRKKSGELLLIEKEEKKIQKYGYRFNIWKFSTGAGQTTKDKIAFKHPAIFPESLARDHIITWSNPGDVILDPMSGSGTTLKMALQLKRRCIAIEQSKEYCKIIKERIKIK